MTALLLLLATVVASVLAVAFGDANSDFVQWFESSGGERWGVGLDSFEGMGRGVLSTETVEDGSKVLHIPSSMIFSLKSFMQSEDPSHVKLASVYKSRPNGDEDAVVAAVLLERCRGEDSAFYPYIAVLPRSIPNVNQFSPELLQELDDPEFTGGVAKAQESILEGWMHFKNKVMKDKKIWRGTAALPTPSYADYKWAAAVVDSRGLRFKGKVNLAPFADMFNYMPHQDARASNSGEFFLSHHKLDDAGLTIFADRASTAQSQLFEDYGDNSDQIYAQYHGFVALTNPFRCAPLRLGSMVPVENEAKKQLVDKLRFTQMGVPEPYKRGPVQCMSRFDGSIDMTLVVWITVQAFDDTESAACLAAMATPKSKDWQWLSAECGFHQVRSSFLAFSESETPLSAALQHDGEIIKEDSTSNGLFRRVVALLEQAMGEQQPSAWTIDALSEKIDRDTALLSALNGASSDISGSDETKEHQRLAWEYRRAQNEQRRELVSEFYGSSSSSSSSSSSTLASGGEENGQQKQQQQQLKPGEMGISLMHEKYPEEAELSLPQQLARFNAWFEAAAPRTSGIEAAFIPGWRIGTTVKNGYFTSSGDDGEGVRTGEVYLTVPPAVIMSAEKAAATSTSSLSAEEPSLGGLIADIRAKKDGKSDDFLELLLLLLWEYFHNGPEGYFWPYLSLLPTPADQSIVPTMWAADKVKSVLGPSAVAAEILEYQVERNSTFQEMQQLSLVTEFFARPGLEGIFTRDNFVWAQAVLDSRSIWWDNVRHLVPMLDFINCQVGPEQALLESEGTVHSTQMEGGFATTRAGWAFPAGSQLFENYGQPNHIYFMYHGFALGGGFHMEKQRGWVRESGSSNTHDCVRHDVIITKEEADTIDFQNDELATRIANAVRMGRGGRVRMCIPAPHAMQARGGPPIPQTWLLVAALKAGNHHEQRDAKTLGQPVALYNREWMLADIATRLERYEATSHLESLAAVDGAEGARVFLESEVIILKEVQEWLRAWQDEETGSDEL